MNPDYVLACGIVWDKTADPEAGLELVGALDSPDLNIRAVARALLIEADEDSLRLLESALTAGIIRPEVGGDCIAEILRNRHDKWKRMNTERQQWSDSFSC